MRGSEEWAQRRGAGLGGQRPGALSWPRMAGSAQSPQVHRSGLSCGFLFLCVLFSSFVFLRERDGDYFLRLPCSLCESGEILMAGIRQWLFVLMVIPVCHHNGREH